MPHPSKRRATGSPSPQLPLHYLEAHTRPSDSNPAVPSIFQIQAHEATLVRHNALARETESTQEQGGRMARWIGSGSEKKEEVWIDRYDILNLIPSVSSDLPFSNPTSFPPPSSSNRTTPRPLEDERGFSDLASDHEEEFYFRQLPQEEREEHEKKRKRRRLERGREERMRLLEEQEAREKASIEAMAKNDEDVELSETQLAMMKKLHSTLSSAQNPSLLEMRILTNHSNDPKFQFLKKGGKWRDFWERIRRGENVQLSKKDEEVKSGGLGGLAGLGGYGSSDSENESENEKEPEKEEEGTTGEPARNEGAERQVVEEDHTLTSGGTVTAELEVSDETEAERAKREEKAEKVRKWARKRKEARERDVVTNGDST